MRTRLLASLAAAATLAVSAGIASAGSWETADVVGQGLGGPTVAVDGAAILRLPNGVKAQLSMATPEAGTYVNPPGPTGSGVSGHPQVFSLWVFVFFNPEECASATCGPADLINDPDVVAGAFNAGGHVVGGTNLNLSGFVNSSSFTFGGANAETIGTALGMGYNLADADIHLAVAPHGALDPALLPASIGTPNGMPGHWWIAIFPPLS
jgi:hypothetical protein